MSDAAPPIEPHDDNSVSGLWETARYFLGWLFATCGNSRGIAARGRLTGKERRDLFHWLRPVEAIVRRLLVAEAVRAAEDLPPGEPGRPGRKGRPRPVRARPCRVTFQDTEDSSRWTVHFPLSGRAAERRAGRRPVRRTGRFRRPAPGRADNEFEFMRRKIERLAAKPGPARNRNVALPTEAAARETASPRAAPAAFFSPWPPARRVEALRRVLENPEPYVRRLARRLARRRNADLERIMHACRPPPERPPGARWRLGESALRHASTYALEALHRLSGISDP